MVLACAPLAATLAAYREGPLPAMTGGFGEPSCRLCHFDNRLNDPAGRVEIAGVPARYEAGRPYVLTVGVRRAGIHVAGFEMTARAADGPRAGQQAGSLVGPDRLTRVVFEPGATVQYLQHTRPGSAAPSGEGRWTIRWTAPSPPMGTVAFHVAANAANDDASPLGDFIYVTSAVSRAR
jgi:hypothetical protein